MLQKLTIGLQFRRVRLFRFQITVSMTNALIEFDKLVRLISRQANVAEAIPTGFVKILVSLDVNLASAAGAKKKMNATNAKALNSMKQKLKKTQRDYETLIAKYKLVRCDSCPLSFRF